MNTKRLTARLTRVSNFNPRYVVWWLEGIRAPTTVRFPTRRLATKIRQSLYALRKAMQLENHYAASIVSKGEIIRRPVDPRATSINDPHTLTIRPVDFDMNTLLDEAGIKAPDLDEDITTPASAPQPELQQPSTGATIDYADLLRGQPPLEDK